MPAMLPIAHCYGWAGRPMYSQQPCPSSAQADDINTHLTRRSPCASRSKMRGLPPQETLDSPSHDFSRVALTIEVIETPQTQKGVAGGQTRPHSAATPSFRDSRWRELRPGGAIRGRSMVCIGLWSTKQMRESPGRRHTRRTHRNPNRNQLRSSFFWSQTLAERS